MKKHRLAVVASHVIQYQDPFFRLLAADPDIDLTVYYCSPQGAVDYRDEEMKTTLRWDIETLTGYRSVMLRNFARRMSGRKRWPPNFFSSTPQAAHAPRSTRIPKTTSPNPSLKTISR